MERAEWTAVLLRKREKEFPNMGRALNEEYCPAQWAFIAFMVVIRGRMRSSLLRLVIFEQNIRCRNGKEVTGPE